MLLRVIIERGERSALRQRERRLACREGTLIGTMTMNLNLQIKGVIFVCGFVLSRRGALLLTTWTRWCREPISSDG